MQKLADYFKEAFVASNLSNWVLVIVGTVGIIFAYRTLRALVRQTRATEIAAKAAQDNIEIFVNKERARLRMEPEPIKFEIDQHIHAVRIIVRHFGPTAAFITESGSNIFLSPPDSSQRDSYPIGIPDHFSPNGSPSVNDIPVDELKFTGEQIDRMESGELVLKLHVFIKYTDVFNRARETRISMIWKPINQPAFSGYWDQTKEGNQET